MVGHSLGTVYRTAQAPPRYIHTPPVPTPPLRWAGSLDVDAFYRTGIR